MIVEFTPEQKEMIRLMVLRDICSAKVWHIRHMYEWVELPSGAMQVQRKRRGKK